MRIYHVVLLMLPQPCIVYVGLLPQRCEFLLSTHTLVSHHLLPYPLPGPKLCDTTG
jgi:hypothetical protein